MDASNIGHGQPSRRVWTKLKPFLPIISTPARSESAVTIWQPLLRYSPLAGTLLLSLNCAFLPIR